MPVHMQTHTRQYPWTGQLGLTGSCELQLLVNTYGGILFPISHWWSYLHPSFLFCCFSSFFVFICVSVDFAPRSISSVLISRVSSSISYCISLSSLFHVHRLFPNVSPVETGAAPCWKCASIPVWPVQKVPALTEFDGCCCACPTSPFKLRLQTWSFSVFCLTQQPSCDVALSTNAPHILRKEQMFLPSVAKYSLWESGLTRSPTLTSCITAVLAELVGVLAEWQMDTSGSSKLWSCR